MKEITYFYLQGCPYCAKADQIIEEICKEDSKCSSIKINKIEERQNKKIADSYDYFYVPCLWVDKEKVHEGPATKDGIKKVFEAALKD